MTTLPVVFMSMPALVLSAAPALPAVAVMATLPLRFISMPALVLSAALALPAVVMSRVGLEMVLGVMGSTLQPARFADGRRNQAAVAIPLQQLAQIVRRGV